MSQIKVAWYVSRMKNNLPGVSPKELCALAHKGCTHEVITSMKQTFANRYMRTLTSRELVKLQFQSTLIFQLFICSLQFNDLHMHTIVVIFHELRISYLSESYEFASIKNPFPISILLWVTHNLHCDCLIVVIYPGWLVNNSENFLFK